MNEVKQAEVIVSKVIRNKYGFFAAVDPDGKFWGFDKIQPTYPDGTPLEGGHKINVFYQSSIGKNGRELIKVMAMTKLGVVDVNTLPNTGTGDYKPNVAKTGTGRGFNPEWDKQKQLIISMQAAMNTALNFCDVAMKNGVWKLPQKGKAEARLDMFKEVVVQYAKDFFSMYQQVTPDVAAKIVAQSAIKAPTKGNGTEQNELPDGIDEDVPDNVAGPSDMTHEASPWTRAS